MQKLFELARCLVLVDLFDRGQFVNKALESSFIDLAFGEGLFRLGRAAMQIAHHFGNGDRITGIDFASYSCARRDHMVRLTRARPLSVINAESICFLEESLRRPELPTLLTGTRKVMRLDSKVIT